MDASQITKLLQKQNTRYINRAQTVDSSTLTWKNQIQSSKYIKGVKTCDGQQNCNVPTNPCCADEVVVNGVTQRTGTYSFGGAGRTTALQTGSPQQFLSVYSGAAGSASQVYSSESILLQKAGNESCGVAGTSPAPQNSYVVLPACYCVDTNGPTNSNSSQLSNVNPLPVNNQSNPYLPAFDTYYAMKNPSAQCKYPVQDQNQKHFVKFCAQCPTETPSPDGAGSHPYVIEPPSNNTGGPISISYYFGNPACPLDVGNPATFQVILGPGTPSGGTFSIASATPIVPGDQPITIDTVTGALTTYGNATSPIGIYTVTYTTGNGNFSTTWTYDFQGC
jgi:hypothetical protein